MIVKDIVIIDKILYKNEEGYSIAKVRSESKKYKIIKGNIGASQVGDKLKVEGISIVDDFGNKNLDLISYVMETPVTYTAIKNFIINHIGLSHTTATKVLMAIGTDLSLLLDDKKLMEVGLSPKTIIKIKNNYKKHKNFESSIIKLVSANLNFVEATKVYNDLGFDAVNKVTINPFLIAESLDFDAAMRYILSTNNDISKQDIFLNAVLTALKIETKKGHTYTHELELEHSAINIYLDYFDDLPDYNYDSILKKLEEKGKIIINKKNIYIPTIYKTERKIEKKIEEIMKKENKQYNTISINNIDARQQQAIDFAAKYNISILTGGPGTGKTHTINNILKMVTENIKNPKIILTAPTGRAAKKMTEATGYKAVTLHSLLGIQPSGDKKDDIMYSNIAADILIIDESSMVDMFIFAELLEVLDSKTKIIIVGDKNQLPSIDMGNILSDLIASDKIPVTVLSKIYRQAEESKIINNAYKIINGDDTFINDKPTKDFAILNQSKDVATKKMIAVMQKIVNAGYNSTDIQILSTNKKSENNGTFAINNIVQNIYNNKSKNIVYNDICYNIGDRVMQTINDAPNNIYNGDIGTIINVIQYNNGDKEVYVDFDGLDETTIYRNSKIKELELAYAITIHKSQGSEYKIVIIMIDSDYDMQLNQSMIYTAITRATEKVILMGTKDNIIKSIKNEKQTKRTSIFKTL